jgi:hypothetical protein
MMKHLLEWAASLAACVVVGLQTAHMGLLQVDRSFYYTGALLVDWQYRPFVYRQLTPFVIRTLDWLTGAGLDAAAVWMMQLSSIGWLLALLYLARAVLARPLALAVVLASPLLIGPFLLRMYMTDMPTLALMTLGLAFLARGQWRAYLLLFPFGVLAHETFAVLGVVYVLRALPLLQPGVVRWSATYQLAALVSIKVALAIRFARNPGSVFQTHLDGHYHWLVLYPGAHLIVLAMLGLGVGLVLWRYRHLPAAFQPAVVLLPLFFFAYVFFGFPGELRAMIGVYPVLLLLLFLLTGQLAAALARGLARLRPPSLRPA